MSIRVLAVEGTTESANRIGYPVFTSADECRRGLGRNDTVIRWGSSYGGEFPKVINKAESIRNNINKLNAITLLSEVVDTPRIYRRRIPTGVRAVVRPMEHCRGSDYREVTGPYVLRSGEYGKEFIETATEYRSWFAFDRILNAYRTRIRSAEGDAHRARWGYDFCGSGPRITAAVKAAKDQLDLDFGAADILSKDDKYYFLELNTAPALDHPRVLAFLKETIRENVRVNPRDAQVEALQERLRRLTGGEAVIEERFEAVEV